MLDLGGRLLLTKAGISIAFSSVCRKQMDICKTEEWTKFS